MNRRDMIIVAVLMNTGILALLFMMAMHTDEGMPINSAEVQAIVASVAPEEPVRVQVPSVPVEMRSVGAYAPAGAFTKTSPHDEIDTVLTAYTGQLQRPEIAVAPAVEEPQLVGERDVDDRFVEVQVKRGDSLDKIARANGTTVNALKRANNLTSDRLQIGQALRVPPATAKTGVAKANEAIAQVAASVSTGLAMPDNAEYYTIKNGDNPWKIAKQFHVRFNDLLKLNNLDEEKARRLKAGDKIRVR